MNKQLDDELKLATEAIGQLEGALVSGEQKSSPEWRAVTGALQAGQLKVACVALEVFASHFSKQIPSTAKRLLQTLAHSIRCSKIRKTKALIKLLTQRALGPAAA